MTLKIIPLVAAAFLAVTAVPIMAQVMAQDAGPVLRIIEARRSNRRGPGEDPAHHRHCVAGD